VSPVPFDASAIDVDGVRVIAIRGELDLSTAPSLEPAVEEALANPDTVMIDLTECEFIDSTGIAMIVRAWQRIEDEEVGSGRTLVVCTCNDQVNRVFEISGLGQSIRVYSSREEGLAALRA
jgi:anti-sigma B factor antagonist